MKIIGFEGTLPENAPVAWAVAALTDDTNLINASTGARLPLSAFGELVADGNLTALEKPFKLSSSDTVRQAKIVIAINTKHQDAHYLMLDTGRIGGLAGHSKTSRRAYYFLANASAFDAYAKQVASKVLNAFLVSGGDKKMLPTIRMAVGRLPSDPQLNAAQVFCLPIDRQERGFKFALASLRSEHERAACRLFYRALTEPKSDYELKYQDGAADGGGFDVDIAAKTLTAIHVVHTKFVQVMTESHEYLTQYLRPPRFHEMRAASAELHFSTNIKGRPLGERVARFIELDFLQEALRGNIPDALQYDVVFEDSLKRIIRPTEDTRLSQRPIGADSREEVHRTKHIVPDVQRSKAFTVLGFHNGVVNDADRIEVRVSAKHKIMLSTRTNGDGEVPEGVGFLHEKSDFLFRPVLMTLVRERHPGGRVRFFLRRLAPVSTKETTVDTIPSIVTRNAFLTRISVPVSVAIGTIVVGEHEILHKKHSFNSVKDAIDSVSDAYLKIELEHAGAKKGTWIPVPQPTNAPALIRVLLCLDALNGVAFVADLASAINTRFVTNVRVNNTRREVLKHNDLLTFVGDDQQVVSLTSQGRAYLYAYQQSQPVED